ncbi:MAG: GNAT family N-acetyltransferase [Halorhabdus sp.]
MAYTLLGWPVDSPTLDLDHERFAYAGKFVMSRTGKAVVRENGQVVAAAAFDADRTDEHCLRVRYVTVAEERRGDGIGARLLRFVVRRARERGYEHVAAGVNNPFAYVAFYKAGLAYTGDRTGLAELVCSTAADRDAASYRAGLDAYRERDLSDRERAFIDTRIAEPVPAVVSDPSESDRGTGDSNPPPP